MARRIWGKGRGRRGAGADGTRSKDSVHLGDEEHAWWAAREHLETGEVPRGRKRRPAEEEKPKESAFQAYFTSDSLFDWGVDDNDVFDRSDPYVVLGLPPSATWEEIAAAHRRLAKMHHPDRLSDVSPEERELSDERIRELNIAYNELRRRKGR